jgi:PIN domain nuclease of toxin-antitoxin system
MMTSNFLLDTCVILFTLEGAELQDEAVSQMSKAGDGSSLFLSAASAWEIGKLVAAKKLRLPIEPLDYFEKFASTKGVSICDLTSEIMVRSSFLPDLEHRDPMDCILIATARVNNYTIITRDRAILSYGRQGHVKTLAC